MNNYLTFEIFDDLDAANVRVAYWNKLGGKNVRLVTVKTLTAYDFRIQPPNLLCNENGNPLYVVEHEG